MGGMVEVRPQTIISSNIPDSTRHTITLIHLHFEQQPDTYLDTLREISPDTSIPSNATLDRLHAKNRANSRPFELLRMYLKRQLDSDVTFDEETEQCIQSDPAVLQLQEQIPQTVIQIQKNKINSHIRFLRLEHYLCRLSASSLFSVGD